MGLIFVRFSFYHGLVQTTKFHHHDLVQECVVICVFFHKEILSKIGGIRLDGLFLYLPFFGGSLCGKHLEELMK